MRNSARVDILKELKPLMLKNHTQAAGIVWAELVCALLGLIAPFLYRFYINQVIVEENISSLMYAVFGYILLYVGLTIFGVLGE